MTRSEPDRGGIGDQGVVAAEELKLDRSFITPMADDPRAAAIVRSTIDLAHSLGMTMVAEGVEDEYTASQLALSSCDTVQGFH